MFSERDFLIPVKAQQLQLRGWFQEFTTFSLEPVSGPLLSFRPFFSLTCLVRDPPRLAPASSSAFPVQWTLDEHSQFIQGQDAHNVEVCRLSMGVCLKLYNKSFPERIAGSPKPRGKKP